MTVVERLEYLVTKELIDDAAYAVVSEFVPPEPPQHPPQLILQLWALAAFCLALLVVGVVFEMSTIHFVITGLGASACLFAASTPWICRTINHALVRFTNYARHRVHERLLKVAGPALGTPVKWEFDEEGFRTRMLEVERRVSWSELKRVRSHPKFWIFTTKRDELMFPTESMTDAVRELILRKIREVGVKFVEA
jgi:hypothetical protein